MSVDKKNEPMGEMRIVPVKEALDHAALDGDGSLTQQVYRLVRERIVALTLLPNQFLSEKDVAASLNISKTPVREAFISLAEDGIVRIVPKSGTYVAPIDIERALEGYFIWNALEGSCAYQAAEQYALNDIRHLRDLLGRQKALLDSGDLDAFIEADHAFHDAIFAIAELPDARKLIDAARFEVDRIRCMNGGRLFTPVPVIFDEHTAIVNAIARHDGEGAREAMAAHLDHVRDAIESLVHDAKLHALLNFLNQKRPGTRRPRADKK